jgi:hypothetical protein
MQYPLTAFRHRIFARRFSVAADDRTFQRVVNWQSEEPEITLNSLLVNSSFRLFVGGKKMGTTEVVPSDDERQEGRVSIKRTASCL